MTGHHELYGGYLFMFVGRHRTLFNLLPVMSSGMIHDS